MAVYKSQYTGQQIDEGINKANRATTDLVEVKADVATNKRKINSLNFSGEAQTTNTLRTIEYNDELYNVPSVSANPLSLGNEIELEKIEVNGDVYKITHPTIVAKDHLYRHRIRFTYGTLGFSNIGDTYFDIYVLGYSTPFTEAIGAYVNPFAVAGTIGIYINGYYNRPVFATYYNTSIPNSSTQWILLTTPDNSDVISNPEVTFKRFNLDKYFGIDPQYTDEVTPV